MVTFFEKPLLYYLRRMVGSEADAWDLVQETWVSVFRALPKLRDARALPAFLYRAARNHALAHLRHRDVKLRLYAAVESASIETTPREFCAVAAARTVPPMGPVWAGAGSAAATVSVLFVVGPLVKLETNEVAIQHVQWFLSSRIR